MDNALKGYLNNYLIKRYDIDLECPVLWEKQRSLEWLKKAKASSGSPSFYKSYQNEIISSEDAIFKKEYLEKATERGKALRLRNGYDTSTWIHGANVRTSGVDLAISEKTSADYTVITTIAGLKNGDRVLLNIVRGKFSPSETRQHIVEQYNRFKPTQVKVESVAYQASLVKDLQDFTSVPVKAYSTGGEKFDEMIGINSLAIDFENGKWIFPYDKTDTRTVSLVNVLIDEMLKFCPGSHTGDILMALWFANTALREIEQGVSVDTSVRSVGMYRKI